MKDVVGATHTATATVTIARLNHVPTAVAGGPYSGDVNASIAFDGSPSTDQDGDVLTYSWDFGDGTTGTGQRPRRSYLTPGTFTATLTVSDAFGGSHTAQAQVTIKAANQAPTANAGGPYTAVSGQQVAFSGAASHDPDGDQLTYTWAFGDGEAATGRDVSHTYASAGSFSVTLTVSDGRGGSDSSSAVVPVSLANGAPTALAAGPSAGLVGRTIAFDGTQSSDPDGDVLTYSWSFGDGGSRTGAQPTHVFDAAGTFTVTLTVADGKGGSSTASRSIVISAPTQSDNHAPVSNAGGPYSGEAGIPVAFTGAGSSDPDGDALEYSWTFGDGASATGVSPSHVFSQAGSYTAQLVVSDGRGGTHSTTVSTVVSPAADRIAPVVQLSGSTRVLPGAQVTVTATAVDNVSVSSVSFAVQGGSTSTSSAAPYERTIAIPAVASPGTTIGVVAKAIDPSGNEGSASMTLTIVAQPDVTPPVVSVSAPAETAPGATLIVGATASDASGVATVAFRVNGAQLPSTGAPYTVTYQVPANAAAGTSLPITVDAFDFAGNRGTATASVAVVAASDSTPPTVDLVVPSVSRAGAPVTLSAQAADAGGVAAVTFIVDGVTIATKTAPPYQATFDVPASAIAGMQFQVTAKAVDFAGLQATDTSAIQIVTANAADGVLTGEVYDDTTGLPVQGVSVTLVSSAGVAPATTDARGRYVLQVPSGDAAVRITKTGWTSAYRFAAVTAGGARELFDARLTPLTPAASVTPVLGGTLQTNGVSAIVPSGAVAAATTLALTRVGGQGLAALLPAGWTPVAAADLVPASVAFSTPVTLRASRNGVTPGTPLVFAAWDPQRRGWRAIELQAAGPVTEQLQALIDGSGQYAWLRPDVLPVAPPDAIAGELLSGVTAGAIPQDVQTLVSPQPKVLVYEPGIRSDVAGTITAQAPLSSGTRLWARIVESYTFTTDAKVQPEAFVEDLVLYQRAGENTVLIATYPVTPSLEFEPATLKQGVLSVELLVPPADDDVHVVDADGGEVTLATGERLTVPAGATNAPLAAQLTTLAAADVGAPVPPGFEFVNGLSVSLSGGTLTDSATLSIPKPAALPGDAQLLLARAETIQGETKLVLVGLGRIEGDRVVALAMLPKNKVPLEGVRAGGRYVFVRAASPVGFVAGQVLGTQGQALPGAQVSTESLRLVSLSRATGAYVAAAGVGVARLTALDLVKSDTGFGQVTIGGTAAEVALDLRLVAQPPRVVSINPGEGAQGVALSDPLTVLFSEPIDPASLATHVRLAKDGGAQADVTSALTANNTILTLRPATPLAGDTLYTLTVEKVKDASGYEMAAAAIVRFRTLDLTAPAPPAAGSISATIPENGVTTVRATQGTAGLHDTVTIENVTRGTSTPVLLDSNGGFLVLVQAAQTDVLKIKIADASGNETLVNVPRFTRANPDGSLTAVVTEAGGRVEGLDGVAVDIDPGTFPGGTLVTIKAVPEASFPVQLTPAQKQVFSYSGGVSLDFGGAEPQRYVDVSVAARAGDSAANQWIVAQALTVGGVPTFNAVDMANFADGRITTASPPCPGVTGQGVYGIYKSNRAVGLNYGEVFHNEVDGGLRFVVEGVNIDIAGFDFPFPVISMKQRQPVCMPVLTGNVSIVENTVGLKIKPEHVTPADRAIQVTNNATTPAAKYSFPRNILEFAFRVTGHEDDPFEVLVEKVDGTKVTLTSSQIASITKDAGANTVTIRLNMDKLNVTPKTFIFRNHFTNPATETTFAAEVNAVTLAVAAAPGAPLVVEAIDASGVARPVPFTATGSTYATGNLALRAVRGTIDPTPDEIAEYNGWPVCSATQPYPCRQDLLDPNHGVIRLVLADLDSAPAPGDCGSAVCFEIPTSQLDHGAVAFPFQGDRTHAFKLHVFYKDGTRDSIVIPGYRLLITSTQTGEVIRRIVAQSPPRGQPLNLGAITNDTTRPVLTDGPQRYDNYDPSQPLTFSFSEAIDEASAKSLILRNAAGQAIPIASVVISPDGKTVTFIPVGSLRLGETYTIDFNDVTDVAGNRVLGTAIRLRTFAPRRLCRGEGGCEANDTGAFEATLFKGFDTRVAGAVTPRDFEPVEDLDFLRRRDSQGRLRTDLVLTLGGYETTDYRMSTVDVTNPRNAFELGRDFGGRGKRREVIVQGLNGFRIAPDYTAGMPNPPYVFPPANDPCHVPNQLFTGNIAVMSAYTSDQSSLTFYNVTDPAHPCVLGDKLLTASPFALNDFNRKNTIHASGFARGVAAIKHQAGISIFTAVGEVGVTATDLAKNIPARFPDARLEDPFYPADVIDLKVFRDRLLIGRRDNQRLEVLDVNLSPLASVSLAERPVRLVTAEAFKLDANGDGVITQSEVRDLAFVATDTCSWGAGGAASSGAGQSACAAHLQVVDITTLSSPLVIGSYRLPGAVSSLDVDVARQRLIVGGTVWQQYGGGGALYLIDISKPNEADGPDADNDGWDDRIVWRERYATARPNAVRMDADRGLAYVGLAYTSGTGRERGAVDIFALYDDCCDLGVDFASEADAHESGPGVLDRELRALKSGIKQGLDKAKLGAPAAPNRAPVAPCADSALVAVLAMLEQGSGACVWRGDCDGTYQPGISDHDYEVFFPQMTADVAAVPPQVKCVIDRLNEVFADHKPVKFVNTVGQPDEMSFDDVTFYPVSMHELRRARLGVHPPTAAGGSDPGGDLGMGRQQLLLKWLLEGEYVRDVEGYQLAGPDLEWTLQLLRTTRTAGSPTGVSVVEGYEWARLMEYNLAKAKTYIRIKGAAQTTSGFHDLFVKQLHDAGKFGLRAALARMVAIPAENERAIATITRSGYRSAAGCVDMLAGQPSGSWASKSCASFEEYVASVAARSAAFSETERQLVARFYRVKSDRESILTERAADAFIAATHAFVQAAKTATYPVYAQLAPSSTYAGQRFTNMTSLVGDDHTPAGLGGKLQKELTKASLKLAPRFYNEGFRNADDVLTAMYRNVTTPGTGTEVKNLRVSLAGGESRHVKQIADAGAPFVTIDYQDRNLNDISSLDRDQKAYQFVLGAGTTSNPSIDQSANVNQPETVVFTIDLPTRSGDPGHLVQEANRKNNYDGFTYYILDRAGQDGLADQTIPLPVPASAIESDPSCFTTPQVRVMSQNISYADGTIRLNVLNTSDEQLTNVQVCSDLAGRCVTVGTIAPGQLQDIVLAFEAPGAAGSYASNITIYGRTVRGQDVALRWNNTILSAGSPFDVRAYDNTPLNALNHPFSRWTRNRDSSGQDLPVKGVTTDGTDKALRIRISKLKPGTVALIRLIDSETRKAEDGIGKLTLGTQSGMEISVTPDLSGSVELYYTPPAYFVRRGASFQNLDFNRIERGARISVVQDTVGVSNSDISLRRPPVFLAHGLFGNIHVWRDFQPLVPFTPPAGLGEEVQSALGMSQSNAQYYVPRPGYDGRFDLFVVGRPNSAGRFEEGARALRADIGLSLQSYLSGYAIGKVDVIGHSMGGVLARKLTNEDPQVRQAIRKLILINSPQGGSPLADKVVEARDKLPVKIEDPKPFDFLEIDPDKLSSMSPVKLKVEWCSATLNSLGRSGVLNAFGGGLDDLRTPLRTQGGALTEVGKLVFGEWEVPTHHVVDTATQNDLGFSTEVSGMWTALGLLCNMTPDATTLEKTRLLQIGGEAVKAIAPMLKGANATRTLHNRPFGSLESKKIFVDLFKGTLKKGLEDVFVGEPPDQVFDTPNDRVVPVWSQLGDGADADLPPGPLGLGHSAVTEVFGATDHQAAKITPQIAEPMCKTVDGTGLVSFDKRIQDYNGDGKPDPTCRIMDLLEADPGSSTFIKTGGQP